MSEETQQENLDLSTEQPETPSTQPTTSKDSAPEKPKKPKASKKKASKKKSVKRTRRRQGPFILLRDEPPYIHLPNEIREMRDAEKWVKENYDKLASLGTEFTLCRLVGNVKIEQVTTTNVNIQAEE